MAIYQPYNSAPSGKGQNRGGNRQTAPSSGNNPEYNAALRYYKGAYEPQMATIDFQQAQQRNAMGRMYAGGQLAASQAGQNSNFANQDYNLGMEKLGLQRQGIGIDENYYTNLLGLLQGNLTGANGYQDTLSSLASQLLGLQQGAVDQTYNTNVRQETSAATPLGAIQSKNFKAELGDLLGVKQNQLGQLQQGYDSTLAGIGEAKRQNQESYDERVLGINHDRELNANQLSQLDIMAKEMGLTRDKAKASLQQALQKMNLDTTLGVADIFDALQSGDFQRQQIAEQIRREAEYGASQGYFATPASRGSTNSKSNQPKSNQKYTKDEAVHAYMYGQ